MRSSAYCWSDAPWSVVEFYLYFCPGVDRLVTGLHFSMSKIMTRYLYIACTLTNFCTISVMINPLLTKRLLLKIKTFSIHVVQILFGSFLWFRWLVHVNLQWEKENENFANIFVKLERTREINDKDYNTQLILSLETHYWNIFTLYLVITLYALHQCYSLNPITIEVQKIKVQRLYIASVKIAHYQCKYFLFIYCLTI